MSGWDAYITALRGDGSVINGAAIYGQGAAPALWASTPNFLKPEEVAAIGKVFTDEGAFNTQAGTGFYINGEKFMRLNSEFPKIIRGKHGDQAACAAVSKRAIIIARGQASPPDVAAAVEKMAADLSSKGF